MNKKKIKKYAGPKYPTKDLYASHPELLFSSVPGRWLKSKAATGALVTFILGGLTDCNSDSKLLEVRTVQKLEKPGKTVEEAKAEKVKIAPLFIHGDGTGATGCIIMSPPVFLSEAEAMDIILNEFKKTGIEFDEIGYQPSDLFLNEPKIKYNLKPDMINKKTTLEKTIVQKKRPFIFNAYNKNLNFGFKFISRSNYYQILSNIEDSYSSVSSYDFIELAQVARETLQACGKYQAAIFYDPLEDRWEYMYESEKIEKPEIPSAELLRMQVSDFSNWFKAQINKGK